MSCHRKVKDSNRLQVDTNRAMNDTQLLWLMIIIVLVLSYVYSTGPYAGFSEGGFEMERKVTKLIIFASGPIIMAWGLGSA